MFYNLGTCSVVLRLALNPACSSTIISSAWGLSLGQRIMLETRSTSFLALSVYSRVGISRSASESR